MTTRENLLWDFITENEIATENELQLVWNLCGMSEETLERVIFARTGLRSIEQCREEGFYYISEELLDVEGLLEEVEEEF